MELIQGGLGDYFEEGVYLLALRFVLLEVLFVELVEFLESCLIGVDSFVLINLLPGRLDAGNSPIVHHVNVGLDHRCY
jgi:hypothetical protein